ncbi:hypothetical protein GT044_00290 [Streptomyces sp. SID335]|uniref:hypothetical protein n=1 Tax=unclassified Streptomyces TaxID=2593676 RepID=UPI00136F8292|nr:hypothetical protein [Streptomyces sp. SID335]NDZ84534.1 hypothetical protein [Streptomyces sp. SID10115]NDZ98545.1 hypothetical protein [Streptomyces sp. SID10116]NEB43497.1 hypothetical protein [Streptomyces sp. SID339]
MNRKSWRIRTTVISAAVAGAVAVSGVGTANAAAALDSSRTKAPNAQTSPLATNRLSLEDDQLEQLGSEDEVLVGIENAFAVIDTIPADVLEKGQEAVEQWLQKELAATDGEASASRKFSGTKCAAGILQAIGSNIFAVVKIYKMKKAIDRLGGIKKVIKKIRDKKKKGKTFKKGITEVFEEAGAGLGAIAIGFLGVDGVIKNCW